MTEEFNEQNDEFAVGLMVANRYLVEKILGKGGQGIVVKASDNKNHQLSVVIKALLNEVLDKWSQDKFDEERRALARLQGVAGIVNLLDSGRTPGGREYTVLEFIDGLPLSKIINDLPHNLPRVARLLQQAATAIELAHQQEIFHRDLKPDNLMIRNPATKNESVKIVDFGIAKQVTPSGANIEVTTNIVGTPFYIAPNVFDGNPQPKADDIYALGLIAYEMLTGEFPLAKAEFITPQHHFNFNKFRAMQTNIDAYPPSQKNVEISAAVDEIILRALAENPSDRFDSAEDFGDSLFDALMQRQANIVITEPLIPKIEPFNINIHESEITQPSVQPFVMDKPIVQEVEKPSNRLPFLLLAAAACLLLLFGLLGLWALWSWNNTPVVANSNSKNSNIQSNNNSNSNSNVANNLSNQNTESNANSDNSNAKNATPTPSPTLSPAKTVAPENGSISPEDFSVGVAKKESGNQSAPASFDEIFKANDGIRLDIYSEKAGFLQIYLKENNGTTQRVYNAKLPAAKTFSFPSPQWIYFDKNPGVETIYVVISAPDSPEKTDVATLDAESRGTSQFTTQKGSAVRVLELNHGN